MTKRTSQPDHCELFCYDEAKVNRVRDSLRGPDFPEMAQIFKVLADETRLKAAYALCMEQELCVCDVANIIGSSLATASHHLRLLRSMGIVTYRKEGKLVFYSLQDEQVRRLVALAAAHEREVVSVE